MISFAICWNVSYQEYESEPEASEFDLGKKIKTPKEIMLEELSLMKNRGSKMFKMRQKRVEKFIYENNPDIFTSESMVRTQLRGKHPNTLLFAIDQPSGGHVSKYSETVVILILMIVIVFQDNLQKFVPSLGGQMGGQMINVGGHFLSKEAGRLNFVGLHPGGGPPVPPPKPGSKRTGAKGEGGAGGQGESNLEKKGKGEGGGESSSLKGWC